MMRPRAHPAIIGEHYRSLELKSRVESASPHGLVSLLYEELLRSLDLASASFARDDIASGNRHSAKAQSIIIALEGSIDFDQGGELATTLAKVYRACSKGLRDAQASNDRRKMTEVREGMSNIAYAWQALGNPKT